MLHIKARYQDTRKIVEVDGVKGDVQRGELVVVSSEKGEELVEVLGYSKVKEKLKKTKSARKNSTNSVRER